MQHILRVCQRQLIHVYIVGLVTQAAKGHLSWEVKNGVWGKRLVIGLVGQSPQKLTTLFL